LFSNDQLIQSNDLLFRRKTQLTQISPIFFQIRSLGSVAEAEAASSTDAEEETTTSIEEMDLLEMMEKPEVTPGHAKKVSAPGLQTKTAHTRPDPKRPHGYSMGKYSALRKRQMKIETEAWEQAAREYKELLDDMCQQKLAPNLPYVKSLLLGWFEPFRDKILEEQEWCRSPRNRSRHSEFFDSLPADMMAVITMHKMMSLLMAGNGDGSVRVVQAANAIGEAIEHEVRARVHVGTDFCVDETILAYLLCHRRHQPVQSASPNIN
jgi:DNA-directed RNA polymerase, mitochondrial